MDPWWGAVSFQGSVIHTQQKQQQQLEVEILIASTGFSISESSQPVPASLLSR